jgi:hypothetical protein
VVFHANSRKVYKCALLNEQVVLYDQGKNGFGQNGLSSNLYNGERRVA